MTIGLPSLKQYKIRLSALVALLALPILVAAPTVHAAVASTQASPAITCESGYDKVRNGLNLYWTANGVGNAVTTNTNAGSCWKGGPANQFGEMKDQAGDCMAWNNDAGKVVMQVCNGASYQLWVTGGGAPSYYQNEWCIAHLSGVCLLAGFNGVSGSSMIFSNSKNEFSKWYTS